MNTDSCTYVIKGGCLAPGFHTKFDNTMTSRDDVDIQVLEWDSEYITYDSTVRTTYNTKQYNGIRPG